MNKKVAATLVLLMMVLSTVVLLNPAAAEEPMEVHATTQRTVVVELFTGAACGPCVNADYGLDDFIDNHIRTDAVALVYHRSIPGPDKLETSETIARQGWYSDWGSSTPNMWVDGGHVRVGGFGTRQQGEQWYEGKYTTQRQDLSQLSMTVDGIISPSLTGTVWVNVTALETPDESNLYLHVVIVRKTYGPYNGGNGVQTHHWTVRKMLPGGITGQVLTSLPVGTAQEYTYNFDLSNDHSGNDYWTKKDDMAIVAFVQTHSKTEVTAEGVARQRYVAPILQSRYADMRVIPNRPPVISQGQLVAAPDATEDDDVTFKVFYADPDDYADKGPDSAKVFFKNETSSVMQHDLSSEVSSNTWIEGRWVKWTTKLGAGTYTYRFNATDGEDFALGDNLWNATEVTIKPRNMVPKLKALATPYTPSIGDTTTKFRFSIMYKDNDNEEPTSAKIYLNGDPYDMTSDSQGPWTDWVVYYYETTLSRGDTHRFYYLFSDGTDDVRHPAADDSPNWIRGPTVEPPNNEPTLTTALYSPKEGSRLDFFEFSIIYTDGEGDHPIKSYIYVDGEAHIMDPDHYQYEDGATFRYRDKLGLGTHMYYFVFNDGKHEVRFPPAGELEGPTVINLDPEANIKSPTGGRFTPDDYVPFSAVDSEDPEGDALHYKWESDLQGLLKDDMEAFDMRLVEGVHNITLTVTDDNGGSHSASVQVLVKPRLPRLYISGNNIDSVGRPVEGDMVTLKVEVSNDGEVLATGVDVYLFVDDVEAGSDKIQVDNDDLPVTVQFTWTAVVGDHTVSFEVDGVSVEGVVTVLANTVPAATPEYLTVEGQKNFKVGKEVTFKANAEDANGDDLTYEWDFGDGSTSTARNPTHTYIKAGKYTVTLKVTDDRGGEFTETLEIKIVKPPSDDSPGYGAMAAAVALLVALLGAAALRRRR